MIYSQMDRPFLKPFSRHAKKTGAAAPVFIQQSKTLSLGQVVN